MFAVLIRHDGVFLGADLLPEQFRFWVGEDMEQHWLGRTATMLVPENGRGHPENLLATELFLRENNRPRMLTPFAGAALVVGWDSSQNDFKALPSKVLHTLYQIFADREKEGHGDEVSK